MIQYCRKNDIHHLMTAHTLDDQLETFLFRLAKGSSRYGLAGMRSSGVNTFVPANPGEQPVKLVRPLLQFQKAQLSTYCEQNGISWVEDPTNMDRTLTIRNAARLLLSPENHYMLPRALRRENLRLTLERLSEFRAGVEQEADSLLRHLLKSGQAQFTSLGSFVFHLGNDFCRARHAVRAIALYRMLATVSPVKDIAYRLSQIDNLALHLSKIESNADLHCANVSVLVRRGAIGKPPVASKGSLSVELVRQPLHSQVAQHAKDPKTIMQLAHDWSRWKLFDNRIWLRGRSTSPVEVSCMLVNDARGVKEIMDSIFKDRSLAPIDWPKTRYVMSAPLILTASSTASVPTSDSIVGFPTLGIMNPACSHIEFSHLPRQSEVVP
jgi:hypothetical protein